VTNETGQIFFIGALGSSLVLASLFVTIFMQFLLL
jgi:hypothetical protein